MTLFVLEEHAPELESVALSFATKLHTYDAGFGRRAFEADEHVLIALYLIADGQLINAQN